jgi:hypothetical protein
MAISNQLAKDRPDARQLILTGSMVAGAYDLPPNLDIIKLPALTKRSDGQYSARSLPLSLAATIAWREQMILQAAIAFEPDLVLVMNSAAANCCQPSAKNLAPMTGLALGMVIEDKIGCNPPEWGFVSSPLQKTVRMLTYYRAESIRPCGEYDMSLLQPQIDPAGIWLVRSQPGRAR